MLEPDEDLKKFEEGLKKPRVSGVKKDRIVTCPGCGKKQTMMQVALGQDVKCRKCGNTFPLEKSLAEDAHMVTMAAVNLQVQQMEMMQRVGKVAPPPRKKITVTTRIPEKSFAGAAILTFILYAIWPLGFIVNIVYLLKARSYHAKAGKSGGAAFLLGVWFFLFGLLPLIGIVVIFILGVMGIFDLQSWIDSLKSAAPPG